MDAQEIRQLIEIFERSSLSELVLERGGARLTLKREGPRTAASVNLAGASAVASPVSQSAMPTVSHTDGYVIKAPLVGTFYRRPAPNEDPYVEVGDRVEKGDIVCIIEAMKVMNEIKTDQAGIVEKIFVEDGKPVEYGQPLIALRV